MRRRVPYLDAHRLGRSLILALAFLPLLAARADDPNAPDPDVQALLQAMSKAMRGTDYSGVFVYRHDDRMDTLQVYHRGSGEQEAERLVSLAGAPREIVRHGDEVACYLPDRGKVLLGHQHRRKPFPTALTADTAALYPYYRFELAGEDRTVGRRARIVAVHPRDDFRFGYRLWIDADSALLLRSDVIDEHGGAIEQVMFTDLDLDDPVEDADLVPSVDASAFRTFPADADAMPDTSALPAAALPPGYQLVSRKQRTVGMDAVEVEHLVYSDGLSTISVFIDAAPKRADLLRGDANQGAVNAYGLYHNGAHITVIGEVPEAAVHRVAGGFETVPTP